MNVKKKSKNRLKSNTDGNENKPSKDVDNFPDLSAELQSILETVSKTSKPEEHISETTRFKFFKQSLLRVLRVYTEIQFNRHLTSIVSLLHKVISKLLERMISLEKKVDDLRQNWDTNRVQLLGDYLKDIDPLLQHKFTELRKSLQENEATSQKSFYFSQFADDYYLFQQDKFRGTYEMIKARQLKYVPQIQSVRNLSKKYPFVDIGFGRGEFLEILKEQKIEKIMGADTSPKYVTKAKKDGFKAVCQDGVTFLEQYKGKLSGVSAFHVAEHMPFPALFDLVYLTHMKLAIGGVAIFETPNVENVLISSHSFYIDHTHITKLPPVFFSSLFEFFKFKKIEILYNLPIKEERNTDTERVLFGPQDYAIVAYK